MNRTDRLLAIILELQGKGVQRAGDLASIFETSKRTIYRDIQALCEAGVPIVAVPGRGYSLVEGYFLPPLSFTIDEATLLLLGADVMRQSFDAEYCAAAASATRKIAGVLPLEVRDRVNARTQSIQFMYTGSAAVEIEHLQLLRQAISKQQAVLFDYRARHDEAAKPRQVNPYCLTHFEGTWYLSAYCHLRQAERIFRLSRMQDLRLLDQTFVRPPQAAIRQCDQETDLHKIIVQVLFDEQTTRWVLEDRYYFIVNKQSTPAGLLVTLAVRQVEDILPWLLRWGSHAHVLEPDSLRQRLIKEAQALLDQYKSSKPSDRC